MWKGKKWLREQMKDPEFAEVWEEKKSEFDYISALVKCRKEKRLTQEKLAENMGVSPSHLARIETGINSPTIATLQKIAEGMGKRLHIEFREQKKI